MRAWFSKIQSSFLLFVLAVSAIVAILSPVAIAHAVPSTTSGGGTPPPPPTDPATLYIAPEIKADAIAGTMGISLALCLTGNNNDWSQVGTADLTSGYGDQISAQDAANGNWFTGDYDVRPGILVWDKADDYIGCNDLFKFGATQSLGASDPITLACDVGFTRVDNKDCLTDPQQSNFQQTSNSTNRGKIYAALSKVHKYAVPPASNGGLSDPAMYVDVMQTLTVFCQATADANVGGPQASPTIQARDHGNEFPVVDGTGQTTQVYYNIPNPGNSAMLGNFADNFNFWETSCGAMKDLAGRYAPAYAAYVLGHPAPTANDPGSAGGSDNSSGQTSCVISDVGWIICPVVRFMANVTDFAYGVVSDMLTTPALDTSTASPMYTAWSIMRNFANVAFVIAFMVIVYSQITGIGLSNYGIKRLLPRVIIAAILVNVSYWICALAIDISNILGSSLSGLLEGASNKLFTSGSTFASSGGGGWGGLTASVIAGTAAVAILFAGLSVLIPLLLAALLAIIVTVIVLTARQALIILLTVISPLAFVAYLLPNTEKWFHKWRELYQNLLLMFPIIAIVFGASKLASTVIDTPKAPLLVQIMGAGVTVVPLFITPILMKLTTGVLGKIGGYVNNPNKGPFDRARKGAEGYRQNRQEYRSLKALTGYRSLPGKGVFARRNSQRQAVLNNRKAELNRANADYISGLAQNNDKFRGQLSQGGMSGADERALAQAINTQLKLSSEEVSAAHATIKEANLEGDIEALQQLATGGTVQYQDRSGVTRTLTAAQGSALQTAAIQQQFRVGDVSKTDELVAQSGSMGVEQRQAVADGMHELSDKVRYYGGSAASTVASGAINSEGDLNKMVADSIQDGKYSAEILAHSDKDALTRIADVAADSATTTTAGTALTPQSINNLKDHVDEIARNDNIKSPDSRSQERLDAISYGVKYTP